VRGIMKRIRPGAIIFDYGNVLSAPQGSREIEAMAAMLGVGAELFREAYWKWRVAYDDASLDAPRYWRGVAELLSKDVTDEQVAALIEVDNRSWGYPAAVLPRWAGDVRNAGLKTALLSNMPTPVREYVERLNWLPAFNQRTFSCEARVAKPAAEIFQHCIDGLGVDPAEILFLDDRPENIAAAETLGLHGIVYTTVEQAAVEVDARFDIPVSLVATLEYGNAQDP
jgi:putative hydrolase of the HAD superfamily